MGNQQVRFKSLATDHILMQPKLSLSLERAWAALKCDQLPVVQITGKSNQSKHIFNKIYFQSAMVAQWFKSWPADLAVPGLSPA